MKKNNTRKTTEVDAIAAAISTIINSPETPNALYEKVADWITTSTNIQDSQGQSILDRWTAGPECIAACVLWAKTEEDQKESAEALLEKAVSR